MMRVVRERYSCNSCIFFSVFSIISPFLPVDVCTLAETMLNLVFLCFVVISLYCLLVVDRFYASIAESLGVFSCCISVSQQVVCQGKCH